MWKKYRSLKDIKTTTIHPINELEQAIVPMRIADWKEGVFSPYSTDQSPMLDSELDNYISENTLPVSLKYGILFELETEHADEAQEEKFARVLKQHYLNKILVENHNLVKNRRMTTWMIIMGVIIFSIAIILKLLVDENRFLIMLETIDIMGWVFMWEATNQFFIERKKMGLNRARAYRIMHSSIQYRYRSKD